MNEQIIENITSNTTTEGEFKLFFPGQSEVILDGVFDGAIVNYHSFTETKGRSVKTIRTQAASADAFGCVARGVEFVVTNVGAGTNLFVVARSLMYVGPNF